MSTPSSFATYAAELLSGVGPVRVRAMFGGHGLYLGGLFIAVIVEDRLYLRVDDLTRPEFQAAGSEPWVYTSRRGATTMTSYWALPEDAVDDPDQAARWGRLALEATRRKEAAKAAGKKPAAPARTKAKTKSTKTAAKPKATRRGSPTAERAKARPGPASAKRLRAARRR